MESMEYTNTPLPPDNDEQEIQVWNDIVAQAREEYLLFKQKRGSAGGSPAPSKRPSLDIAGAPTRVSDTGVSGTPSPTSQVPKSSFLAIATPHSSSTSQSTPNPSEDPSSSATSQSTPNPSEDPSFQLATGKYACKSPGQYTPLPTATGNRFSPLSTSDETDGQTTTGQPTETQNPPPTPQTVRPKIGTIHIDNTGLTNATLLLTDLNRMTPNSFHAKSTRKELIIHPKTPQAHKTLIDALDKIELTHDLRAKYFISNISYHHHKTTEERHDRLVIKGLSPNIPPPDILTDLQAHSIKIHHISEMKRRNPDNTLTGLGLYILEINKRDSTTIKNIKRILHHTVTLEDYRQNDRIPRCDNCQMLFHTKHYCHRPTICAKCGDHHHYTNCTNDFSKCANCNLDHPAYSPDCPALQKAKQDRQRALTTRTNSSPRQTQRPNTHDHTQFPSLTPNRPGQSAHHQTDTTYASITQTSPTTTPLSPDSTSTISDIKDLLSLLKSFNIPKLISTAKELITIIKGPDDTMTKTIKILTKLCDLA